MMLLLRLRRAHCQILRNSLSIFMLKGLGTEADPRLCKLPFQEVAVLKQDSSKYLKGVKSAAAHTIFIWTRAESAEGVAKMGLGWFRTDFRVLVQSCVLFWLCYGDKLCLIYLWVYEIKLSI
ncbi:hypothetical protein Drorol1_Dr00021400 [Drosera rotundifolia]